MRAFITVLGKDRRGIIATISAKLYELDVNILDINQTIMQDNFTMVMLVQLENPDISIGMLQEAMDWCAKELSMDIRLQREDIFSAMHRI
ncbi:MAG: ACT domain-containing protein [Christensenellales bacterium]|jgi:ACT domain-containing protein